MSIKAIINGLGIAARDFSKQFSKEAGAEYDDYLALKRQLSVSILRSGKATYPELLKEALEEQGVDTSSPVHINKFDAQFLLAKEAEVDSSFRELGGYCKAIYDAVDEKLPQKTDVDREFNEYIRTYSFNENEFFLFVTAIKFEWYKRVNEIATELKEGRLNIFSDDFDVRSEKLQKYLSLSMFGESEYKEISDLMFGVHERPIDSLLNFSREKAIKNLKLMLALASNLDDKTTP